MTDKTVEETYEDVTYDQTQLDEYVERVLQLEAVACKDWLTNKVIVPLPEKLPANNVRERYNSH